MPFITACQYFHVSGLWLLNLTVGKWFRKLVQGLFRLKIPPHTKTKLLFSGPSTITWRSHIADCSASFIGSVGCAVCRLSSRPYYSYFSLLFLCSYFSLLFSENALLSLLFSPQIFELTKHCNFFPLSLEVCKNWINLIWAVTMQKFMKYFYFSCNSFLNIYFGIYFSWWCSVYCSEKAVFLLYLF